MYSVPLGVHHGRCWLGRQNREAAGRAQGVRVAGAWQARGRRGASAVRARGDGLGCLLSQVHRVSAAIRPNTWHSSNHLRLPKIKLLGIGVLLPDMSTKGIERGNAMRGSKARAKQVTKVHLYFLDYLAG